MKKVICIVGSPNPKGNCAQLVSRLSDVARTDGAEIQTFHLNSLTYRGCQACYACKGRSETCVLKDDLSGVLEAVRGADVVVMASPVYIGEVTGQLKLCMDRLFSFLTPDFYTAANKSRLAPGKAFVFIRTQGHPVATEFSDIFPRYSSMMKWLGFDKCHEISLCGIDLKPQDDSSAHFFEIDRVTRLLIRG